MISRSRILVIHNPTAGRGSQHRYEAVLTALRRAGCAVEVVETRSKEDGQVALATAQVEAFDAVVAAGGDGTVHDVASGMLGHATPFGVIPIGTANVFARELGLPRSPDVLAQTLLHGSTTDLPVGEVNGQPFLFVVGVGLDADAVRIFEASGGRAFGRLGLAWPVLAALLRPNHGSLRVKTESGKADAPWVVVTRTKRYAADLMLAPAASLHGTKFYVLRMTGDPLSRFMQLSAMALGALRYAPGVEIESTEWVEIDGAEGTPIQVDGELMGQLPLLIRLHPTKLKVIRA
jgi:diacylglycerol kinase (ATP)